MLFRIKIENKIGGQELLEVREKYVKEKGKPLPRAINFHFGGAPTRASIDLNVELSTICIAKL